MRESSEPPPLNDYDMEPPPEFDDYLPDDDAVYDPDLAFDPYPPPSAFDAMIPDDYTPDDVAHLPDFPTPEQDGLQGLEPPEPDDADWSWHDARLIGVDRGEDAGANRYEVGAMDVYADTHTGDVGGSYLPIATFGEDVPATAFYHDLQRTIHEGGIAAWQLAAFAEGQARQMQSEPTYWRGAEPDEYDAYVYTRDLDTLDPLLADDVPRDAVDPLLHTALQLGGVAVEQDIAQLPPADDAAFQALSAIGVQADAFDPQSNPPPFYDAETGTAYWIGVFQPDKADRDHCVTSILSLGRDPETGQMAAQLAPCVPGDWDKTYAAAEYLIEVAGRGGIEQVFDTAEGMALATDQRDLWDSGRGLPLEPDAARDIAAFAHETWELEL